MPYLTIPYHMSRAHMVGLSVQFLVVSLITLQTFYRHESIITKDDELTHSYDYIVVGSGSSGSIVANRLAEDGHTRVLLLEAGPPQGLENDIPAIAFSLFNTRYDWNFTLEPQPFGRAYYGGVIKENRGFVLGGTCSFNHMIYNRGNRRDYDAWAQQYGAIGWSYKDVLPFFLKYENNLDPHIVAQNPGFHSTSGPIEITSWPKPDPFMLMNQQMVNTEGGIPTTDINGANQVGTAFTQGFIGPQGQRSSSASNYIDPNPFPHNLHILTGALVTRILIHEKTAVGVLYERSGHQFKVMAQKEVIVSGGVHNSPKILMLSGIGPKWHLDQFHIPVVMDLPVGENFHNHASMDYMFLLKPESAQKFTNIPPALTTGQIYEWMTTGTGPLSQLYRAIAYFSTKSNPDKEWPNVSWETGLFQFPANFTDYRVHDYASHEWTRWYQRYLGRFYLLVHPIIQRVRSRGWIRLASTEPHIAPRIQPNFLRDERDYQDEIEMNRVVLKLYELSSLMEHLEPIEPIPGCSLCPGKKYMFECESYIRCAVEQTLYTTYHGVGSCRMGDPQRKDVVVDPELKVKGISGLRVCDASIMPLLPNSNTNAASLMIGEKCAYHIKSEQQQYHAQYHAQY